MMIMIVDRGRNNDDDDDDDKQNTAPVTHNTYKPSHYLN